MEKIAFEDPLLLLLLLPLLFLFYILQKLKRRRSALMSTPLIKMAEPEGILLKLRNLPVYLQYLALILSIIALARPQAGKVLKEIKVSGIDIMLILDSSGSMQALDFQEGERRKTRFDVAKAVISDFLKEREGDRIGLIVFGEYAYTQCPLTVDYEIIRGFLEELEVGVAGDRTAMGDAIALAVKRLKDVPSKSRIAILLTDGRSNTGIISPSEATELAKTFGIKIYTVGIGSEGRSPFLIDTFFGKRLVYQEVELDEEGLKSIASQTGGKYFRARSPRELREAYETINRLEKTEREVKEFKEFHELYPWFLLPAFFLSIGGIILSHTIFRRCP